MADRPDAVQYANVNVNTAGTNQLVATQAGMRIYLINMTLIAQGAVTVTIEDGGGTDRIGPLAFAANGGISMADSNVGWTRTANNDSLNIRLSANIRVAGSIAYRYIPEHVGL